MTKRPCPRPTRRCGSTTSPSAWTPSRNWENTKARLVAHGIEVLGVTDHHIFKSIYFFDPNGIRLELSAQLADEVQMARESTTAHARLNEWTARKEQWRKERAEGKAAQPLKPQSNDRPEFVPDAGA